MSIIDDLQNYRDGELQAELDRRKQTIADRVKPIIKAKPDVTELKQMIQERVDKIHEKRENMYTDDDFGYYLQECVFKTFFGEDYYDWFNLTVHGMGKKK